MPLQLLLDTDPGVDDSMAILFALQSPELDVLGLTPVFGNGGVGQTTCNALRVLEVAGRSDIPVAAGAATPLMRPYRGRGAVVHGEDGLGNNFFPPPKTQPLSELAAAFIARTVLNHPGEITLIAVGPLTNLALAARLEPRIVSAVKGVIVMGGAAHCAGNISPVAEANVYNDPEAAAVVFSVGWPLTMVGLDVTMRTVMTQAYLDELALARNPLTDFIARISPHYFNFYHQHYGLDGVYTHDPSAIAYAIDPSLFRTERAPIFVETEGRCAGQTVADKRKQWVESPEVNICIGVDSARLLKLFKERLTHPR
ncbi:MAG TPA: nucleoside hydrolase [Anaerolineales bacterium]|nr:nucleoside hydrolase [Anaerolineales bacterium]